VEQGDRLGTGGLVGVVADEGVDPVWIDGLVTAYVARGEREEADVGHHPDVVPGPPAHPVDVERPG
jgi:hypothetical protein